MRQKLLRMDDAVTGVRIKLSDIWQAWAVARDLANRMEGVYLVRDWTRDHANFFRALKMEKTVMFILLSLVVAIAAFNLVSSQVMLVQDKQADIAILRTLGLSPRQVMQVFMVQGLVIGLVGVALGVVFGVLLSREPECAGACGGIDHRQRTDAGRCLLHQRRTDGGEPDGCADSNGGCHRHVSVGHRVSGLARR